MKSHSRMKDIASRDQERYDWGWPYYERSCPIATNEAKLASLRTEPERYPCME